MYKYKGWLPTVTTRLSFSEFGSTSYPSTAVRANVVRGRVRFLVCYQRRWLSDTTFPFLSSLGSAAVLIEKAILGKESLFHFVVLGQTSDDLETFSGSVLVFLTGNWMNRADGMVAMCQRGIERMSGRNEVEAAIAGAVEDLSGLSCFHAKFCIQRMGLCELEFSPQFATDRHAPSIFGSDEDVDLVASQVFYFLRDIAHNHQHHSPSTDTILDVHRFRESDPNSWVRETSYSLFRAVISSRRRRDVGNYYGSLGILSYAEAFLSVCGSRAPKYLVLPLRNSLQAAISKRESKYEHKRGREAFDSWAQYMLAVFAALFALLQLVGPQGVEPHPALKELARKLATKPAETICVVIVMGLVLKKMFGVDRSDVSNSPAWRAVVRIVVGFKSQSGAAISVAAVSIAFIAVGLYLWGRYFLAG